MNSAFVHCLRTHKFYFLVTFSLKMGLTILFTHLKIILLQYFQFQFSVSAKISSIQTDKSISAPISAMMSHSRKSDFLFWRISWRKWILCCKEKTRCHHSSTSIETLNSFRWYTISSDKRNCTYTNFNLKSRLANLWVNSNSSLRYSHIWAYFASFQAMSDL